MSKRWAKGSTSAWRRIRAHVLARDAHRCTLRIPTRDDTGRSRIRLQLQPPEETP